MALTIQHKKGANYQREHADGDRRHGDAREHWTHRNCERYENAESCEYADD